MRREFHATTSSYSSFKRLRAGCGVLTIRTSAHLTSLSTTCSALGDSTLMTSAPKSDRITAALGPAMKLAKSTTFNPEKMLSLAMGLSAKSFVCGTLASSPLESRRALFEEGARALLLIVGRRAKTEVGGFQRQP